MDNNNGFKEVSNLDEMRNALDEIRKSWEEICEAFEVDPDVKVQSSIIKSSIKMTLIDLNELENMDYVKNSNKKLEKLHETYVKNLVRFAYYAVGSEESIMWKDEVKSYINEIFTQDLLSDMEVTTEEEENVSLDMIIDDMNRILSIANQLNVIRGMESGNFEADAFVGLINNYSYLGIGIVQTCNGNAAVMGQVVTFLKVMIKTNDVIIKQISDMIMRARK